MGTARPGAPDVRPRPRSHETVPDLYGARGAALGLEARRFDPPERPDPDEAPPRGSSGRRRRQLGSDRRATRATSTATRPVSDTRVAMGRLAIIVTVAAWIAYVIMWFFSDFFHPGYEGAVARTEEILYLLIVTLLTVSALAYLLTRLGFMYRTRTHHRATRAALDRYFDARQPTLTTIIPSYQEEERVIMTTLLSAALQEYPDKRVVLLIDDPHVPKTAQARRQLESARALPGRVTRLLAEPARRFAGEMQSFELALERGERPTPMSMVALADTYKAAVNWLANLADQQEITDHADEFFVNEILLRLSESFDEVRTALLQSAAEGVVLHPQMFRRLYRRLVWTFSADVSGFERKKYVSLSHEANKAMNLNSYIGLMGGSYDEIQTVGGTALVPARPHAGWHVPNPDYVVTLDADSMLLPDYCLRLVHLLEQQEYQDIAIAQTPYSAFPGSGTRLERIAGATTDLQHIVHQGMTYYDATFWVGANAVIRKRALDQIAESSYIGDWEVKQYIKDRTVIEDTESTIDMGIHGWRLFNYPERLSYSATPPDFGSLCIQRRRWANGGLLILPKLHRQARTRRQQGKRVRFSEQFLRWNYMASICWSSVSLLILLTYPFSATLISPLLGLVALPYFFAMASDLRYCGYKRLDVVRIYGFNLILLGVNLAGTFSSVVQGITSSKAPFARTPKVKDRTVVPPFLLLAPYILIVLAGYTLYRAYLHHLTENAFYAALNVILACYAVKAFIGLRNSLVDGWIHATSLLYRPADPRPRRLPWRRPIEEAKPKDWRSVLQAGYSEPQYQSFGARPPRGPSVTLTTAPAPLPEAGPAKRRLSLARAGLALLLVAAVGYGGYVSAKTRLFTTTVATRGTWFAPYVDVTLTPTFQFQNPVSDPAQQSALGFVVASSASRCAPSWGAFYSLTAADQQLAMGTRIAQLQQEGEQAIVSFGGQANTSLDVACRTTADLTAAYQSVIGAYRLKTIDLDIEGTALDDFNAGRRRAAAIAAVEKADPRLSVWLTLPVEPDGLQDNALSVIREMLNAHVSIAGVNLMTMDFGHPPGTGSTMGAATEAALRATHGQLATLYPEYGIRLSADQVWQRLGATVMIGQNDVGGESFKVNDAKSLAAFARANHLGRISMWSINRDTQCGSLYSDTGVLSTTCSGTPQSALEFSQVFGQFKGSAPTASNSSQVQPAVADTNPADAPYPLWNALTNYPAGYKIVENGEIYQAKWFNTGDDPSTQVQYSYQTPWELLGPVVPGDHAAATATLPAGTYPAWSQDAAYQAGDKVLYAGLAYQAKWDNQGVSPATAATDISGSAWKPLNGIPGEPGGGQTSPSASPHRTGP